MPSDTVTPPVGRSLVPLGLLLLATQSYQLVAFPNVLDSLRTEPGWHLSPSTAGLIGSTAFLGVLAGMHAAMPLARRLGLRRTTLAALLWLTLWSGVSALATAPWQLGFLRMLAGIGTGVAFPLTLSLVKESATRIGAARQAAAPEGRRTHAAAATRARRALLIAPLGIPIAGFVTQNTAGVLPTENAWRLLTAFGAGLGVIALALCLWLLPRGADMYVLDPGHDGLRKPSRPVIVWTAVVVTGANLIAWSGLTGLDSVDLRFNAALSAGAVVAIFVVTAMAIHRSETSTSRSGTARATMAFILLYPPTTVLTLAVVLSLLAGQPLSFVMPLIGVWIADGYCRSLTLGVAPRVLDAFPHPALQEHAGTVADAGHITQLPPPFNPGPHCDGELTTPPRSNLP
ncbi:MFS transporter [Streptomyces pseudovenezuelae]|uniref:MFS transporter n=1 Tax=Streptomyces pseudovenezuelae TaxID=67350 RepID=UPI002E30F5B4|nr:MFS transporter [Streptomyces pseudovenezuelae]